MSGLDAHFLFGREFSPNLSTAPLQSRRQVRNRGTGMALNLESIRNAAARVAASHGLDVVDVEYRTGAKPRALCIFIEKNAKERARLAIEAGVALEGVAAEQVSGITHEDCTAFSRDFGTLLDVEDMIPGTEYTLEVSSPGLDRKLHSIEDFRRFAGSLVKLQTFEPVAGNRHWQGRLTQVNAQTLTLDLSALKQKGKSRKAAARANQEQVEVTVSNIQKANLVPEF